MLLQLIFNVLLNNVMDARTDGRTHARTHNIASPWAPVRAKKQEQNELIYFHVRNSPEFFLSRIVFDPGALTVQPWSHELTLAL